LPDAIDLPFTLVADTVLIPLNLIYILSGYKPNVKRGGRAAAFAVIGFFQTGLSCHFPVTYPLTAKFYHHGYGSEIC
tara:strand:- start:14 stop:244 length:231 start_codon:yes stop_codon:yes gene_type:complete